MWLFINLKSSSVQLIDSFAISAKFPQPPSKAMGV